MSDTVILATNYTKADRGKGDIRLSIVHTMEAPEKGTTAESCARYFQSGVRASAHWMHDNDSSVRGVYDKDVAWAAPGANHDGIQHECAGYAAQGVTGWKDPYSQAMLRRLASHQAADCRNFDLPANWLSVADVLAGKRGLTSHDHISKAYKRSDHYDPGPDFPVGPHVDMVRAYLGGGTKPKPLVWRSGGKGYDPGAVKFYQAMLNLLLALCEADVKRWGTLGNRKPIAVDGAYGPGTAARTKEYEVWRNGRMGKAPGKLQVDGVCTDNNLKYLGADIAWMMAVNKQNGR